MDIFVNLLMESIENPFFNFISKFIDIIFNPEFLIIVGVIIAGYFLYRKFWKRGFVIAGSLIFTGIFVRIFKDFFMRIRPQNSLIEATGYSLPSGHVSVSIVFLGLFIYLLSIKKSIKIKTISCALFFVLIFIIGFSRIYLRVHWLTDVLASFLLGGIVLIIGIIILSMENKVNYR